MNLLEQYIELEKKKIVKINHNKEYNLYTVKYLHNGVDFSDVNTMNARGLTLDVNGNIIIRGFKKFFNYKQLDEYKNYNENFKIIYSEGLPNNEKLTFLEKLDGTLLLLSVYKDNFIVSTSSNIDNEYTKIALEYFNNLDNKDDILDFLKENKVTFAFEYTSPNNPIAVRYNEDKFTLIAIHENKTGYRYNYQDTARIGNKLGLLLPNIYRLTLEEALLAQKEKTNFEGFVVVNKFNNLIKIKTDDWYKLKNKTSDIFFTSNLTFKKIELLTKAYIEDTIDDLLALENQNKVYKNNNVVNGFLDKIKQIEEDISKLNKVTQNIKTNELNKYFKENKIDNISASVIYSIRKNKDWKNEKTICNLIKQKHIS